MTNYEDLFMRNEPQQNSWQLYMSTIYSISPGGNVSPTVPVLLARNMIDYLASIIIDFLRGSCPFRWVT